MVCIYVYIIYSDGGTIYMYCFDNIDMASMYKGIVEHEYSDCPEKNKTKFD